MSDDFMVQVYVLLQESNKTFNSGLDRLSDKVDEIRENMATHREVDDLKNRMTNKEKLLDLIREEHIKRNEFQSILQQVKNEFFDDVKEMRKEHEQYEKDISELKNAQGRFPPWVWPTVISSVMLIISWFIRGVK